MSDDTSTFRPNRSFTKRMLIANNAAAWSAIFGSIYLGQPTAATVVPPMAALLFMLFGVYTGVGHLDMRAATALANNQTQGGTQ